MNRAALVSVLSLAACDARTLSAVGAPPGVYRPNAGCAVTEGGGAACPLGLQWGFEDARDVSEFRVTTPGTLANASVTCQRSYCGTGALMMHAVYRWEQPEPTPSPRMGTVVHKFATPVELLNRELSFRVMVKQIRPPPPPGTEGFVTPVNGQIAFISNGRYRIVWDGPLNFRTAWQTRGGVVGPGNTCCMDLPASTTSIKASQIDIDVYLATRVFGGDEFEGEIYLDEIGYE